MRTCFAPESVVRQRCVKAGALVLAAVAPLAGCGGKSTPAPVAPQQLAQQLFMDVASTGGGSYVSVLTATGYGRRRFAVTLPRTLAMEMSCRGGRSVQAQIDGGDWLEVACGADRMGSSTDTFRRGAHLTVVAPSTTRWSLVLAARRG